MNNPLLKKILDSAWRPYFGWVISSAFGYLFLGERFLVLCCIIATKPEGEAFVASDMPIMDTGPLIVALTALLSSYGVRAWEKKQGIASSQDNKNA